VPHSAFFKNKLFYHVNFRGAAIGKATYKLLGAVKNIRSLYWTTFNAIFQDHLLLSQYTLEYAKNGLSQNDQLMLHAFDYGHKFQLVVTVEVILNNIYLLFSIN
jgi:hypothetical protein